MLVNKEFYTRPNYYNKILRQYNDQYYLIEEQNIITSETRNDILLTKEEIINYLSEQDFIIEKVNKSIESHKKMLEIEQKKKEEQKQKEKEYNNTYGYCDNKSPMQKGRMLKTLNTKENSSKYGVLTRKEFIYKALQDGYKLRIEKNYKTYSKRAEKGYTEKETAYILDFIEYHNVITKIEYDYGIYLMSLDINLKGE